MAERIQHQTIVTPLTIFLRFSVFFFFSRWLVLTQRRRNLLINDIEPCCCGWKFYSVLFTPVSGLVCKPVPIPPQFQGNWDIMPFWKVSCKATIMPPLRVVGLMLVYTREWMCLCDEQPKVVFKGASCTGLNGSYDNRVVGCHGSLILVSPLAHSHSTAVISPIHTHRFSQASLPFSTPFFLFSLICMSLADQSFPCIKLSYSGNV